MCATELLLPRGNDIDRQSSPMHHIQTGMETIECEQLTCMLCKFILTFTVLCFMVHGEAWQNLEKGLRQAK